MAADSSGQGSLAIGLLGASLLLLTCSLLVNAQLLQRLRRRNLELQTARGTLERERRMLRQKLRTSLTAAAVAHEINQPLSSLSLISERLIAQANATPGLAEALPLLQGLLTECQRVVELIEKMRMLLRSVESEQRPVALVEPVIAALTYLRRLLAADQVALQTRGLEDTAAWIHGDQAQLQMAVTNLLRNALAALSDQPLGQRQLALTLQRRAGWLELIVADSGPGLPPAWLTANLTDQQAFQSTRSTGMGLGLYLVNATVENHRGDVMFGRSSQLGGAEVTLRFPLLEAPPPESR
jgi:signal transduction histidine kinase